MCQLVFVQVNGVEVVGSSHEEAAILLKTASYRVDLVLAYCPAGMHQETFLLLLENDIV